MPNAFTEIAPINQYVSQFVPLPLEEMMKAGAMKQEAYDKAMADVSTAETPIVGGNITKDQAAMLNQKINSDLSKLVDEANKNDNYSKLQKIKRAIYRFIIKSHIYNPKLTYINSILDT